MRPSKLTPKLIHYSVRQGYQEKSTCKTSTGYQVLLTHQEVFLQLLAGKSITIDLPEWFHTKEVVTVKLNGGKIRDKSGCIWDLGFIATFNPRVAA